MRPHVVRWLEQLVPRGVALALAPTWFTCVGLAGVVALFAMLALARRRGLDPAAVARIVLGCYVAAVAAGIAVPSAIAAAQQLLAARRLEIRWAGMTSFWGYLAGGGAVAAACRAHRVPLGRFADLATAPLGVVLALARVGCFLAGCDYGKVTSLPWAVRFPAHSPAWHDHVAAGLVPAERAASLPVHPTQLYEAALGVVIAGVALAVARRARRSDGRVFLLAAAIYAAGRFAIEELRGDAGRGLYAGLASGQIFSLVVLAAVAVAAVCRPRRAGPRAAAITAAVLAATAMAPDASAQPVGRPYALLVGGPSAQPVGRPSAQLVGGPSAQPVGGPSAQPVGGPSAQPVGRPSAQPVGRPSAQPVGRPSAGPPGTAADHAQPLDPPVAAPPGSSAPAPRDPPGAATSDPPQPPMTPGTQAPGAPPAPPAAQAPGAPPAPPALQAPGAPPAPPGAQAPGAPPAPPAAQAPGAPPAPPAVQAPGAPPAPPGAQAPGAPPAPPGIVSLGPSAPTDVGASAPVLHAGALVGVAAAFNRRRDQVPTLTGAPLSLGLALHRLGAWIDLDSLGNRDASHGTLLLSGSMMVPVSSQLSIGGRIGLGATLVNFDDPVFRDVIGVATRFEVMIDVRLADAWALWLRPLAIDVLSAADLGGPIATWQARFGVAYHVPVGPPPRPSPGPSPASSAAAPSPARSRR